MEFSLNEVWDSAIEAHQIGNFSRAEELYSAVILHFPQHEDAHHNLAVLKYQCKQYDKSLISVSHAILLNESKIEFWNTKLKILTWTKSYHSLIETLTSGLDLIYIAQLAVVLVLVVSLICSKFLGIIL